MIGYHLPSAPGKRFVLDPTTTLPKGVHERLARAATDVAPVPADAHLRLIHAVSR